MGCSLQPHPENVRYIVRWSRETIPNKNLKFYNEAVIVVKIIALVQELVIVESGYQVNQNGRSLQGMASFTCRDIGIDCPFETHATTDNELMRKFIKHAESAHNLQVLSADVIFKVQNAIKKKIIFQNPLFKPAVLKKKFNPANQEMPLFERHSFSQVS